MAKHAKKQEARVPGWIWLLTGVALGTLITLLMRLTELQPTPQPLPPASSVSNSQDNGKDVELGFYTTLKDNEIVVEQRRVTQLPTKPKNTEYMLQVASFRTLEDAEQARAELTLLNLSAHIEKADIGKGQTWHRVLVGPFTSRSQLAKARDTLFANRFEALVLERKKPG